MSLDISLVQVLDAHADGRAQDVHVAIPGTIVSWDHTKQTATVQPMVRKPLTSADNILCYETPPQIPNVPVMCMRGGGFFVSVPLNAGDGVLLVFSEQSYSEWRSSGQISSPKDVRRHGTGYPYAIPGIAPDNQALTSVASNALVVGLDNSDQQIEIDSIFIKLGRGATDFVAMAAKVNNNLSAIQTTLLTGVAGTVTVTFGTPFTASDVSSTVTKVK